MNYDIPVWWITFGIAFIAAAVADTLTGRGTRLVRRDLGRKAMKKAYVRAAPGLGGGLAAGRAVQMALWVPSVSLAALAVALLAAVALTVAPKYPELLEDAELVHLMNAPFYVGLAVSYVCDIVLLGQYYAARRAGPYVGEA